MAEGRSKSIPGLEKYSGFPHTMQTYKRCFNEARRLFSHPVIPDDIRVRAEDLAVAYASSRTEETFSLEDRIKLMSVKILQVGDEVIAERGWSSVPENGNFAWQLRGADSENASSLRLSAKTGKPLDLVRHQLRSYSYNRRRINVARFGDIPDVLAGASTKQSSGELMRDLFTDMTKRLGFTASDNKQNRSRLVRRIGIDYIQIIHPNQPFIAQFYDHTAREPEDLRDENISDDTELRQALREVIQQHIKETAEGLEDEPARRFNPNVVIEINLHNLSKVRTES